MSVAAILIALVLAFLAFKFVKGLVKFGVIAVVVVIAIYFLMKSGGLS
jgi:hypothetical protein